MKTRFKLRLRLIIAFVLLTLVITSTFALGIRYALLITEQNLINKYLLAEVDDFIEYYIHDKRIASRPRSAFTLYIEPNSPNSDFIPDNIQGLAIGFQEVQAGKKEYHVFVRKVGQDKLYFVFDLTDFEDHEAFINESLVAGIILAVCLSVWLGYFTGSRVISPVRRLATQISKLHDSQSTEFSMEGYANDEVGVLAHEFEIYIKRLQAFLERERIFTADVSHELRTPLTVINGAAEVLLANPDLNNKTRNQVARIYRTGTDMAETISAFLLLAREPERDKTTAIESHSVAQIVQQQMDQLQHLIEGSTINANLIINEDIAIATDPQLLSIVIANLIKNAYTYTKEGEIIITVNKKELWVEDTGPGIKPELRDKVFERSFQINKQQKKGSGIGLSIARRLANRYHWTITIDGRPDGGGTKAILRFSV